MDSEAEARYRLKLAEGHLSKASSFMINGAYDDSVGKAQLSVENSAKAIVSCFRVPSWSHDPSEELDDILTTNREALVKLFGESYLEKVNEASEAAATLAPERGKATYGDVISHTPPWEIYDRGKAEEALALARKTFEIAKNFVEAWFKG